MDGVAVERSCFASFVKQKSGGGRKEKAELSNYFTDNPFFDDDELINDMILMVPGL
jgi:hypothetical protein